VEEIGAIAGDLAAVRPELTSMRLAAPRLSIPHDTVARTDPVATVARGSLEIEPTLTHTISQVQKQ
jgi:hypothetical protein